MVDRISKKNHRLRARPQTNNRERALFIPCYDWSNANSTSFVLYTSDLRGDSDGRTSHYMPIMEELTIS